MLPKNGIVDKRVAIIVLRETTRNLEVAECCQEVWKVASCGRVKFFTQHRAGSR